MAGRNYVKLLTPAYGAIAFIFAWWLIAFLQLVDPVLLPSPQDSAKAIWVGFFQGNLFSDLRVTVVRTLAAFTLATLVCVPLGLVLGSSVQLYRSLEFVIDFFRSTPASALFPLFLVILGVGESTKIAVAAFGAGLLILFNTAYGVMNARKVRQAAAFVMGASKSRVLVGVTLLESLPQTFIGMRSGVSFALVIVIVAEMFIGSTDGLGQRVINAQMIFNMPEMYATIFTAGVLGYSLNLFFILIERHFVHWGGK
jgi:ABC-type nitrate/sulfonate/bicarbonate transport system permease component